MDRKEMVLKLSEFFGVKQKYLGPPSFAYEVRAEEETYTIDRYGVIRTTDGRVIAFDEILNPKQPEEKMETLEEPETLAIDELDLKLPLEDHTGATLQNIVNMLSSKQHLIMKAFELQDELMDETFAEELSFKEISTIEDFKKAFIELGPQRCPGLAIEEETFTFKLVAENLGSDKITAFQDLAALINDNAKKLKRASFKPTQDDNPKYALRTWLIRLGMNGSAAHRKPSKQEEEANG